MELCDRTRGIATRQRRKRTLFTGENYTATMTHRTFEELFESYGEGEGTRARGSCTDDSKGAPFVPGPLQVVQVRRRSISVESIRHDALVWYHKKEGFQVEYLRVSSSYLYCETTPRWICG